MPANPTRLLLTTTYTGGGGTSNTFTGVSPAANALVVVYFVGSRGNGPWSASSTFGTVDGWTQFGSVETADARITAFWAVTNGAPGSGDITLAATSGVMWLHGAIVDQVASGFNTTTPVGTTITSGSNTTTTTPVGTFAAVPASGSLLMGAITAQKSTGSDSTIISAPAAGLTHVGATDAGATFSNSYASLYGPGSHGDEIGWTLTAAPTTSIIVGIEVLTDEASPVLTSPTYVAFGTTTVTPRVTTDTDNGTIYHVVTLESESPPGRTQVEAGNNASNVAAIAAADQPVTESGVITFAQVTGLNPGTAYRISYAHRGTPAEGA